MLMRTDPCREVDQLTRVVGSSGTAGRHADDVRGRGAEEVDEPTT